MMEIPVGFLDVSGGHLSNDVCMQYTTEAVSQLLIALNYSLQNVEGSRLVFRKAQVDYKKAVTYPSIVKVCASLESQKIALNFKIEIFSADKLCAEVDLKTVLTNNSSGKVVRTPLQLSGRLIEYMSVRQGNIK